MDVHQKIREIEGKDKSIRSFISLDKERVSEKGAHKDGKLKGLFLGIKSNICVEGLLTSGGSKTLENYIAPYDATVVERIKKEGGTIIGMTNMDEFACGSSGETSYYGQTDNPAALGHIPGGSSSGSAAAVAAGFADAALGTDTGGSIRNPASHCGIVGFKPTYGVVSRYGVIDLAMSLDQVGPLARDVKTASLLLEVISGNDPKEETSLKLDSSFYRFHANLKPELKGKKLGYAKEFDGLMDAGIKKVIHSALDKLSGSGAEIVEVSLPNLALAIPTYYLNVYVEFFSATRKYDGRRYGHKIEEACGEEVLRRILLGSYISQKEYSGKFYRKALMARSLIRKDISNALKGVDALVGPTVPKLPHKLGTKIDDPRVMYAYDVFTVLANLAGIPAGTVPAGKVNGIPTGLQVMGDALADQKVLDVMCGFEKLL
jgi:aspartyl-tRNA(Asn)/glutamyl-tRNA(Gln) amidotransferase subunit A